MVWLEFVNGTPYGWHRIRYWVDHRGWQLLSFWGCSSWAIFFAIACVLAISSEGNERSGCEMYASICFGAFILALPQASKDFLLHSRDGCFFEWNRRPIEVTNARFGEPYIALKDLLAWTRKPAQQHLLDVFTLHSDIHTEYGRRFLGQRGLEELLTNKIYMQSTPNDFRKYLEVSILHGGISPKSKKIPI